MIAQESSHWYFSQDCEAGKRGDPCLLITGKNGKERAPNLGDMKRGLPVVPSVTTIQKLAASPGLEQYKIRAGIKSALGLARHEGETDDEFISRVLDDSKDEGRQAADRGTVCHAAIEIYAQTGTVSDEWRPHVLKVEETLAFHGLQLRGGLQEHSFVSKLGYGGKVDWHDLTPIVLDFKSKDRIERGKKLAYDNHVEQLAAYGNGLFTAPFRAANVFIGVDDCEVVFIEHEQADLARGWKCFEALLSYWKARNL